MLTRLLLGVIFIVAVTGCATTQNKSQIDQMQSRVTELEKKLGEKDSEIVDLQYQVKDLSSKVETSRVDAEETAMEKTITPVVVYAGNEDLIRVNTTPEKIQKALKAAGNYTGKVDGKIGPGTKAAVIAFQKSQGLHADGVVGKKTWDALKKNLN